MCPLPVLGQLPHGNHAPTPAHTPTHTHADIYMHTRAHTHTRRHTPNRPTPPSHFIPAPQHSPAYYTDKPRLALLSVMSPASISGHENTAICPFHFFLQPHPQLLEQCLESSRCSISICGMNENAAMLVRVVGVKGLGQWLSAVGCMILLPSAPD